MPGTGSSRQRTLPRRTFLGAGLAASVAALAGCSQRSIGGGQKPTGPDLVIGASLELTGAYALMGTSAQRGLQVALDGINADGIEVGGKVRRIKLVVRDSGSDPDTAASQVGDLVTTEKAIAVIGGAAATTSAAMAPVAQRLAVPLLSLAAADGIATPVAERRFVFTLAPDASAVADVLVARLHKAGVGQIGLLAEAGAHGDAGVAALTESARGAGITVAHTVRLPSGTTGYAAPAAQVTAGRPKATVIWAQAPTALAAATAVKAGGYPGDLYFDAGVPADDTLDAATMKVATGAMFVAPLIMSPDSSLPNTPVTYERQAFFTDFSRRYGLLSTDAVFGADALRLVATAAERTGDPTPAQLRDALESAPFALYAGQYTFSATAHGGVDPDQLAVLQLLASGWTRV